MTLGPTPEQRRWMDLRQGLFLHFGINTFHDVEWSGGDLDQSVFNPTELDTDQWCGAARDAGMKFVVLVCKHHDSFCNWPSKYGDYGVAHTPFKGDIVGSVAESARKFGLKFGIYYSLWDRRRPEHNDDEPKYVEYMLRHLEELLTQYGEIVECWFDGMWKKLLPGHDERNEEIWKKYNVEAFLSAWNEHGRKRWGMDELYALIRKHQPGCLVLNNTTTHFPGVPVPPVDARPGEKATDGSRDQKVWTVDGVERYLPLQIETTLSQKGPPGPFADGSWFWHPWDHTVATQDQIRGWLRCARTQDAVILINAGPMANGKMRPEDVQALRGMGAHQDLL